MKQFLYRTIFTVTITLLIAPLANSQINFNLSFLNGENIIQPTSLMFGPDDRLYVAQQDGAIKVYTIVRDSANSYTVVSTETINLIKNMPNHNDDGTLNLSLGKRQITGMIVIGTATNPVIYVNSSDPRIAIGYDSNLDTNSGILSKLTWNGSSWDHVDIVRGFPRCEENHSMNGLYYDQVNNIIYLASGGNTNMGAPSNSFAYTPEYAYSAAILTLDMDSIENMPVNPASPPYPAYIYNLPTLDDEDRAGVNDFNDPFGGNDGKNQAKITVGSPLQVYSPGWRNPYDVIISSKGHLFSIDNAGNSGWGGPALFDSLGNCTNLPNELNSKTHDDNLHIIPYKGYYKGHPNPARASVTVTFNSSNPQAAVDSSLADGHCDYLIPGLEDSAIAVFPTSTNGFAEYTGSNFGGALQGDLIATCLNENIYRIEMDSTGANVISNTVIFSGFGNDPLDVVCLNDTSPFPGTIWICLYGSNSIAVFEPNDFSTCTGINSSYVLDDDNDGYSNADETDNGTDPCNNGSRPEDFSGNFLSNLNDPDDDADGILDELDAFALDPYNGTNTFLPHRLDFDNSPDGGIKGWGFTGMMINGTDNYLDLYDVDNLTIGGAAFKFTIDSIPPGDAYGTQNNQSYGFQMGVNVGDIETPFTVKCRVLGPFATISGPPVDDQSFGMYIGTGDQDNYLKIVCHANSGQGGLRVLLEDSSIIAFDSIYNVPILDTTTLILYLTIDPTSNQVTPYYSYNLGLTKTALPPVSIPSDWIEEVLACGFISTSGPNTGNHFTATWDWIDVRVEPVTVSGNWNTVPATGAPLARHENGFVRAGDKFVLLGGRGIKPVDIYDINTQTWSQGAPSPIELHHFQAIEHNGLIFCIAAFNGLWPSENKVPNVYIYDVVADKWMTGPVIPASRQRGSAASVVYNDKIYVVGGLVQGHIGGWSKLFDEYDPATNTWTVMPDAPRTRDHACAIVIGDKLYLIGGLASGHGSIGLDSVRAEVDIYDFIAGTWSTLADSSNFPIPRAGPSTGLIGNEILLIGGESNNQIAAHNETHAFDIVSESWRTVDSLIEGRHGTQSIISNSGVYITAGSGVRGANLELNTFEMFHMFGVTSPTGSAIIASTLQKPYNDKFIGAINTNGFIDEEVTIHNSGGNQGILISDVMFSDASNFSFMGSLPNFPIVLPPGDSISFNIRFEPTESDTFRTALQLFHSGNTIPDSLTIWGVGDSTINFITRINTGGGQYTTQGGDIFMADDYFSGGNTYSNVNVTSIDATDDDSLYFTERSGPLGFSYNIPVLNDKYDVVLHFAELYWGVNVPGGPGKRIFNVDIEGMRVLNNFDLGEFVPAATATTRVFGAQVNDGNLDIDFSNVMDQAKISAIEVIPVPSFSVWYADKDGDGFGSMIDSIQVFSTPTGYVQNNLDCDDTNPNTYPGAPEILDGEDNDCDGLIDEGVYKNNFRINCGGEEYISVAGDTFVADVYFDGGTTFTNNAIPNVSGTTDDAMYKTERTGVSYSYGIPVVNNQIYNVILHFAEIFWGAAGGGIGGSGLRVFDVVIEGDTLIKDFDMFSEAGAAAAIVKNFSVLISDSIVNIEFIGLVDQAKISAIEVLRIDSGCVSPTIDSLKSTSVSCHGASDGSADLEVSGSIPPYSYLWSNAATTEDLSGIAAGTYTVTVTDSVGCIVTSSVVVSEPSQLGATSSKANISCHNQNNGTASVIPSGGTSPYSYSWDTNPVATTGSISSLAGGNYICTVTDANGCSVSRTVSIFNPSEIIAFIFSNNPSPGDINLAVSGGIAPYTYNWSTGATTEDLSGMAPGFYFCQIADRNGCAKIRSVNLSSPIDLVSDNNSDSNPGSIVYENENDESATLFIYPNPADRLINIFFESEIEVQTEVSLFDLTGRSIKSQSMKSIKGLNALTLQLADVPTGIYQVRINNGSKLQSVRLFIVHE